jgi:signal transduction histidine kinase
VDTDLTAPTTTTRSWRRRAAALGARFEAGGRDVADAVDGPGRADWVLTAALAVIPLVSLALLGPEQASGRWGLPAWVAGALLVPQLLPLAWRRTAPDQVMGIVGWSTGAYFALGFPYTFNVVGALVALNAEAAYGDRRRDGLISLGISLAFILGIMLTSAPSLSGDALPVYAFNVFVFVTAWATGDALRSRRLLADELRARAAAAEHSREVEAGRAVLAERTRIARELHDLIAHTVSVMVVQAGAGRRVAHRDTEGARDALVAIETTGRSALAELRRLVAVLRDGDDTAELVPQPGLEAIPELVATLVDAGVPVRYETVGTARDVPSSVGVSAYRIVQEALTNVLKHAGHVRDVAVTVRYDTTHVTVEIVDDGRGAASDASGAGAGLIGMRERVALFGGSVTAGPRAGGGYRVHADLPTEAADDDPRHVVLRPTGA